ncbi:ECF-type sigma factor [Xanthomonadaceae bacterium JHOS43]|nr:ECF-type sigma factor [Xanthomonadaceae bacterium JHOS43]MCX7562276.1 ECF-type sigma factor [Xanthomonadaceae bacterium XH05]
MERAGLIRHNADNHDNHSCRHRSIVTTLAENDDPVARITQILAAAGEANPLDVLMPVVHADLRRLARAQRRQMEPGETLSTTALVNEAYLKLRRADYPGLEGRAHFFSLVARAMRQILIDHARSRLAEQRRMQEIGRELEARPFEEASELARLLEVNSVLDELERTQPRLAQVVLYRYFAGYTPQETADLLDVHVRTVTRDWHKARAWLMLALERHAPAEET